MWRMIRSGTWICMSTNDDTNLKIRHFVFLLFKKLKLQKSDFCIHDTTWLSIEYRWAWRICITLVCAPFHTIVFHVFFSSKYLIMGNPELCVHCAKTLPLWIYFGRESMRDKLYLKVICTCATIFASNTCQHAFECMQRIINKIPYRNGYT